MPSGLVTLVAAVAALAVMPATASAAPKKAFFKWSAANYTVAENAGQVDLIVQRSGNTTGAASVDVSLSGGTATNGNEYSFTTPQTLNFSGGQTTKRLTVTLNDNSTANPPNKTAVFRLGNPSAGTQVKVPANATLTIVDDEGPGQIDFSSSSYTVLESGGVATITVTRTGASNLSESVDYVTEAAAAAPATPTADYTPIGAGHTLVFAPGEMSKTFQVQITDDSDAESPENVGLRLQNPQNLSLGAAPAIGANTPGTLTINDDDVSTFSFASTLFSAGESAGTATIAVNRGGATNIPASIGYSTSNGTATQGSDYTATSGTLDFAAGETQKTFSVTILDDSGDEPNETVDLSLSNGEASELSIVDDDNPTESVQFSDTTYSANEADSTATITVTLSHPLGVATSVHYATADGSATAGTDYAATSGTLNFAAGATQETFTITLLNPGTPDPEDPETVNLTLSGPGASLVLGDPSSATLTIADDDAAGLIDFKRLTYSASESGGVAEITVERVGGVGGAVAVDYATSDGSAAAGSDYTATSGTLTWAAGDAADKTFTVPLAWDGRGEGAETINLALSDVAGADLGPNTAAVIRVADDGASGPLELNATSYSVGEDEGLVAIAVTRSGGSLGGPVTVDFATADGGATAGSDYAATSGTLTFGPGESAKSFAVPIAGDSLHEGAETFKVTISNPGGGASLGARAAATVTIGDDDGAPQATAPTLEGGPASLDPAASQITADKRPPKLAVEVKKVQKALKAKLIALTAVCDESCSISVVAKTGSARKAVALGKASLRVAPGVKAKLKVKLSKKALARLAKARRDGKAKVAITVVAKDAAGNRASVVRTVSVTA